MWRSLYTIALLSCLIPVHPHSLCRRPFHIAKPHGWWFEPWQARVKLQGLERVKGSGGECSKLMGDLAGDRIERVGSRRAMKEDR